MRFELLKCFKCCYKTVLLNSVISDDAYVFVASLIVCVKELYKLHVHIQISDF